MIQRPREFLDEHGFPPDEMLRSVLDEHTKDVARLRSLKAYYRGEGSIVRRMREPGLPNNRIAHPFARYITTVATGYLIGAPAAYSCADTSGAQTLAAIDEMYRHGSIASIDVENARHASIYGRGVEYLYVDDALNVRATALNPENAFVVYDDTHEANPLFGVYYTPKLRSDGTEDGWRIWIMGDRGISRRVMPDISANSFSEREDTPHYFGGVPMIEYWNDEDERGDFEWVTSLIDAYAPRTREEAWSEPFVQSCRDQNLVELYTFLLENAAEEDQQALFAERAATIESLAQRIGGGRLNRANERQWQFIQKSPSKPHPKSQRRNAPPKRCTERE